MEQGRRPPVVILVGPTASGKSELAIAWMEQLRTEIISADSGQVYRYMDIGTAKPSREVRRRWPHHLVDVADPDERFSASQFERLGSEAITRILAKGHIPLLVGGTGLYIRALMHGLFEGPHGDEELRAHLRNEAAVCGVRGLHRKLREIDPDAADRIHPNDLFRIIRAFEVFYLTGVPISRHQQRHAFVNQRYHALYLGLTMDRSLLYGRIDSRVHRMVNKGLVQEVESLLARGYGLDLPAMHAIGYRHIGEYLKGGWSLAEALRRMGRDTKHYARRQLTWFRKIPQIIWFRREEAHKIFGEVQRFLDQTL